MSLWAFLVAAVLLSLERLCYIWAWHAPESFRAFCARPAVAALGEPVAVLEKLFYGFKAIQFAVFLGWCYLHGGGPFSSLSGDFVVVVLGGVSIVAGQLLNFSVFYRLGRIGVFYGNKFGYEIAWSRAFPFSFLKHPQYVGVVLSIWGFFLAIRFPHDDWYLLPMLETTYYVLGIHFEQ
jgi:phosphatidyl-N-methylethanolamine N-methyltransferase